VRVKGRVQALKIYQLLARSDELTAAQQALTGHYAEGLAHWRAREFGLAVTSFDRSAEIDRPSELFRERARELAQNPPAEDWDPVRTLQEK
jgi:adenylate cyclase/guanylate cyclase